MTHRRFIHALLLTLALAAGCGGGASGGDWKNDFDSKLDSLEAEFTAQAEFFCECYAQLPEPYASKEMCISDQSPIPQDPAERQCVVDASALNEAGSDARLDCELAASEAFTNCLDQTLDCNNLMNSYLACYDAQTAAIGQCPPVPAEVEDAVFACFGQ